MKKPTAAFMKALANRRKSKPVTVTLTEGQKIHDIPSGDFGHIVETNSRGIWVSWHYDKKNVTFLKKAYVIRNVSVPGGSE